ncbi:MAG: hypothetical protein AAF585_28500, partial [Verrucomicrobiota bacterium]
MQADANAAGKMVKCPGCGAKIKIPEDPKAQEKADAVLGLTQKHGVAPTPSGMEELAASATQPPKPNIPLPDAAASSPPPPTTAPASAAAEPSEEPHQEEPQQDVGPRPIEYFYGGKVGNLASINFWLSLGIGV